MIEINIILIIGIINYILFFLNKRKFNILSCGIIAWAGKDPKKFNKSNFNILGIFNETRGKHSCGVSVDGTIRYGLDSEKLYRNFANANKDYLKPINIPIVIGHTRWATGGAHNAANAHPFGFGDKDSKIDFIGVHNGSLHNEEVLAKKYDIKDTLRKTTKTATGGEIISYRRKIDSEILLEIIYKNKDFKVLNYYNGAAALVFYNVNEPNAIYCYHGASKKNRYANTTFEERPLYYYKESKNSLYISSLEESLEVIGGDEKSIGSFEYNKVYKIIDGDISKATIFKVDRTNSIQTFDYQYRQNHSTNNISTTNTNNTTRSKRRLNSKKRNTRNNNIIKNPEINIHTETPINNINDYKGSIYFNKLRFYRNGHLINGIYTFIKGYGYYFLDEKNPKEASDRFYNNVNKEFFNGDFIHDASNTTEMSFIPFKHGENGIEIVDPPLYYFIEGIQVKTELDFLQISTFYNEGKILLDVNRLSFAAKHPIIDINKPYLNANNQNIIKDGKKFTGIYCMLGSDRIYKINEGNLIETIKSKSKAAIPINKTNEVNKTISTDLIKIINKDLKNDKASENFTNELVRADLDKMLLNFYTSIPSFISQLEKYDDNKIAKTAIDRLTAITNDLEIIANLQISQ